MDVRLTLRPGPVICLSDAQSPPLMRKGCERYQTCLVTTHVTVCTAVEMHHKIGIVSQAGADPTRVRLLHMLC